MNEPLQQSVSQELILALGIEKLSEDDQMQVIASASGPIIQGVTLAILEKLPEDAREPFMTAIESGDGVKTGEMLSQHIPNATEFIGTEIRKAVAEFKTFYEAQ